MITFTLFEAAYYCEIMRAGIQSISRGQVWAGYALGLNYWQTMGKVVLPQAFRNMMPMLLTQTIILFQDTSLVYVLSITDFLGAASRSRSATGGWSRCTCSSRSSTSSSASAVRSWSSGCRRRSPSSVDLNSAGFPPCQ